MAADQNVSTVATIERVIAGKAVQCVTTSKPQNHVVAGGAVQRVTTRGVVGEVDGEDLVVCDAPESVTRMVMLWLVWVS